MVRSDPSPVNGFDAHDASLFDTLRAASIAGRTAFGPRAGHGDRRIGQGSATTSDFTTDSKLCANFDGFSLHAAVRVDGCNRERLERLCRYALRPPIVHERLSLTRDGKVLCKFKRRWRDESTHVVLDPLTLIERLTALIPAPRKKLVSYHGVLAPAFPLRHSVVPPPPPQAAISQLQVGHADPPRTCSHPDQAPPSSTTADAAPQPPTKPRTKPRSRYPWADLLRRVYLVDVLTCPHCKRSRRLLAFITDPDVIARILRQLGLPTEPPLVAPARPPPADARPSFR